MINILHDLIAVTTLKSGLWAEQRCTHPIIVLVLVLILALVLPVVLVLLSAALVTLVVEYQ